MNCLDCEKIQSKKNIVYEDPLVVALLAEKPAAKGHVIL